MVWMNDSTAFPISAMTALSFDGADRKSRMICGVSLTSCCWLFPSRAKAITQLPATKNNNDYVLLCRDRRYPRLDTMEPLMILVKLLGGLSSAVFLCGTLTKPDLWWLQESRGNYYCFVTTWARMARFSSEWEETKKDLRLRRSSH